MLHCDYLLVLLCTTLCGDQVVCRIGLVVAHHGGHMQ